MLAADKQKACAVAVTWSQQLSATTNTVIGVPSKDGMGTITVHPCS